MSRLERDKQITYFDTHYVQFVWCFRLISRTGLIRIQYRSVSPRWRGGRVPPISSDVTGIIKGFVLGLKFSIPVFFWIGKLIWKRFFGGGLILVRIFLRMGVQNNLKIQMVWRINKHKHSISNVLIFRVISFNNAFRKLGVNFWSSKFWGFVGSSREFFDIYIFGSCYLRHLQLLYLIK